jgi:beta-mannanase
MAVTWEPWEPTPVGIPNEEQGAFQVEWCHQSILDGQHDDYIDAMARAFRDSGLTIYLRYAHEQNGNWYPWCRDAELYVLAWKYVRRRVRSLRGAWNVRMVWAPNPDLWRPSPADWLARVLPFWPGPASVDLLGFTMIQFGGDHGDYPVFKFAERFDLARRIFQKPILAPEVNVAKDLAIGWLHDLASYVSNGSRPLSAVILSQGLSRAEAASDTGDLSWSVDTWPEGRDAVALVESALHQ